LQENSIEEREAELYVNKHSHVKERTIKFTTRIILMEINRMFLKELERGRALHAVG
jgi:hypothetical protein